MTAVAASARPRVLVLGDDSNVLLAVVRSLGRRGIDVHVGWCPEAPALQSRYITRRHELAAPGADRSWLPVLLNTLASERFDLVLPASEGAWHALQRARTSLVAHPEVHLIAEQAFEVVSDKGRTMALASALGIATPASTLVSGPDALRAALATTVLPVIVKPLRSVQSSDVTKKSFVLRIDTRDDIDAAMDVLRGYGETWLVQECVDGHGVGVEVLAAQGDVLFAFQHVRLHETSGFGSTYRESVAVDPTLLAAASRVIRHLEYTGVAMVEFRVSPDGSRFVLLEVNGRFWGSLPLAVAAGADFPYFLFQLLVTGRRDYAPKIRLGLRARRLPDDLRWLWRSLRGKPFDAAPADENSLGWRVNPMPRATLLRHVLGLLTARDRIDSFARDDPHPGIAEILGLARFACRWALGQA